MTEGAPIRREPPSELSQFVTVVRYEMLKHLRSRRLIGSIVVILLIVSLIYSIPILLNNPYSGHVSKELEMLPHFNPYFPNASYAELNHSNIINTSIVIHVNGTLLPEDNWTYEPSINAVTFAKNMSAYNVTADFDFKEPANGFAETFMQFANMLIIILVTFFGADALVSEYQSRTAYLLFPNPIRRETMLAGKFAASFIACISMVGLFYLLIVALSAVTIGDVALYLLLSFGFAALYLAACLSVAYFISSIMKGSTGAIILTFFLLLIILPIVESIGMISGMKMWFMLTFTGTLPTTALSWDNMPVDHTQVIPGMGVTIYNYYPDPGTSIAVLFVYIIIFTILSAILFRRKQLTG